VIPFRIPVHTAVTERRRRAGREFHVATELPPELAATPAWQRRLRAALPAALVLGEFGLQIILLIVLVVGMAVFALLHGVYREVRRPDTAQARAGSERRRWFVRS
jgi:hypothetical protein